MVTGAALICRPRHSRNASRKQDRSS